MNPAARNANSGRSDRPNPPLQPGLATRPTPPATAPAAGIGPATASGPPLDDDRLEWTPEVLAACLGCRSQKITYHCRQLERRGRLHKTDGVWRFDYITARLLLKHIVDNGHHYQRRPL